MATATSNETVTEPTEPMLNSADPFDLDDHRVRRVTDTDRELAAGCREVEAGGGGHEKGPRMPPKRSGAAAPTPPAGDA